MCSPAQKVGSGIESACHSRRGSSGAACPLVLRLPCGGGLTFGSFHSQELDSFLLAMPGLKALYPSTPQDAFNALLAAYELGLASAKKGA